MIEDVLNKEKYLNIITSQHRQQIKYIEFVLMLLEPLFDMAELLLNFNYNFDLDFATGNELDIIGKIVGVDREVDFILSDGSHTLNDEDYRFLIKAKIAQNYWDGSREKIFEIWDNLFPNVKLNLIDNQDMTCLVFVNAEILTENQINMFFAGLLVPRPVGVQYNYVFGEGAIFSFDMDTEYFKGWDEGTWVVF